MTETVTQFQGGYIILDTVLIVYNKHSNKVVSRSRSWSRSRFHSLRSFIDFDPLLFFIYSSICRGVTVTVTVSQSLCHGPIQIFHCFRSTVVLYEQCIGHGVTVMVSRSRCHGHGVTVIVLQSSVKVLFRYFIASEPVLFFYCFGYAVMLLANCLKLSHI